MANYQGTWIEQCAHPIDTLTYGGSSVREKVLISAPDATGKVKIQVIEEFFNSQLTCYDYSTQPFASVNILSPIEGVFDRVAILAGAVMPSAHDVLKVTQPVSTVEATGAGVTTVALNGVPTWRITFGNGESSDRAKNANAGTGEIGLLLTTVNGVPRSQLSISGSNEIYVRQ